MCDFLHAASNTMTSVPQTDILRTGSGASEHLQIISLCRDSNPSAEALAQLLRNPSCFAGVNYGDDSQKSPLIEGERLRSLPKHSLRTLQVSNWSLTCSSATVRGHIHLLPLLISSGADLNHTATFQSKVKQTFSALHIAIVTGQLDAVKLLLQSGSALFISKCGVHPLSGSIRCKIPRNVVLSTTPCNALLLRRRFFTCYRRTWPLSLVACSPRRGTCSRPTERQIDEERARQAFIHIRRVFCAILT